MEEESEEVEGNHRSHLYLFRVCILRRVFRFFFCSTMSQNTQEREIHNRTHLVVNFGQK